MSEDNSSLHKLSTAQVNKMSSTDPVSDPSVHRLEGTTGEEKGGLIIRKKGLTGDSTKYEFKKPSLPPPRVSLLGLDKLAAAKRKQDETKEIEKKKSRVSSYEDDVDEEIEDDDYDRERSHKHDRHYRQSQQETPSHPGGVSSVYRQRVKDRKDRDRVVQASTKEESHSKHKHKDHRDRRKHDDRQRDRRRDRDRDDRSVRSSRSYRDWDETPARFRDEPETPKLKSKDTPSSSAWDEDDPTPLKRSSWDLPTPSSHRSDRDWDHTDRSHRSSRKDHDRSERSDRKRHGRSTDTPLPTPSYKYNSWMKNGQSIKYTPKDGKENRDEFENEDQRSQWEEEQKRLDREWYNVGEGYDESNNPFADSSEEYTKKKKVPTATLR